MIPNSKTSTLDQSNPDQFIESDDEMETTEKLLEDYYEAMIEHNHTNFHMIQKICREERKYLRSSIGLFNICKLPYSSTNYLFIVNLAGAEMRQRNNNYTAEKSTP